MTNTFKFQIKDVIEEDTGLYKCQASCINSNAVMENNVSLLVKPRRYFQSCKFTECKYLDKLLLTLFADQL